MIIPVCDHFVDNSGVWHRVWNTPHVKQYHSHTKKLKAMNTIEAKAAKLGLDKGYYLLLMAILEEEQSEDSTLAEAS